MEYLSLCVMHRVVGNRAPSYLCTFQRVSDVHSHFTRNSQLSYVIPHVKTQGRFSFMHNAAKLWNGLPDTIKAVINGDTFKKKCKMFLFRKMALAESSDFLYY